jgi:succinyl-CoA synthetase beta subunit
MNLWTKGDISLYSINLPVFVTEAESVYCAVRTGSLNQTASFVHEKLTYSNAYVSKEHPTYNNTKES